MSKAKKKEEAKKAEAKKQPQKQPEQVVKQVAKGAVYDENKNYVVREGCAITSRRGVLGSGHPVKAKWFVGGNDTMKNLVEEKGIVVEAPAKKEAE
jgi:3-deoxy-D-arabino-heptulosonate 7-phosphate (DAHP) synthase